MNKNLKTLAAALLCTTVALSGCTTSSNQSTKTLVEAVQPEVLTFAQASDRFMTEFWPINPSWAMWSGNYDYADKLTIPNQASRDQTRAFVAKQKARFAQFDLNALTSNEKIDYYLIQNHLDKEMWSMDQEKSHQWNPSIYNVAGGFAKIFNGNFDSLDNRLRIALKRLANVPAYYQAAYANITTPTLEHTQLAISQNQGGLSVFSDQLLSDVAASGLTDAEKQQFNQRVTAAKAAINQFVAQLQKLESQLTNQGNARSFRLGSELYEQKFGFDIQSGNSAKQLYDKALADKENVLLQMTKLTDQLWPKYFPYKIKPRNNRKAAATLIKHIAKKHVKREDFVSEIRNQIPALEAFIIEKDLINVDPEKPLVVRETPAYMRGIAGASISAPGPFEKKANTYYNVTPLDDMTAEQAESYLREYNHWMLQILNIHEAIPGHYTQLVYSNDSSSLIKSVFSNGAMVEGWAVYTERMMLEEGYGDFEPELWLMYYKWNLRVIANTILDYAVHNLNMTKAQGLDLLMNEAFQEQAEAEGKWRRVTLSQVQLTSYYSGYREIYDFREARKAQQGDQFNLKAFHERFLSYGSAPVKYIKQLMTQQ